MKNEDSPRIGVLMDKLVFGALPRIAREEVNNLQRLGLNTSLLLIKRGEIDYEIKNLKTDFLEDQSSILSKMGLRVPGFSFFSAFHFVAPMLALKFKIKPNLLISHGTYTCFTAYSLRKTKGIPYFAYIYDPMTYILRKVYSDASLRYVLAFLLPLANKLDRLIVNSSEGVILLSKHHLTSIKQMTDKPVHIVYPGTDVAERIPSERGNYLLTVARWERGKNPFFLLALLKNLRQKGVRATLLMDGPWKPPSLRAEFLQRVKKDGLQSDVSLIGPSGRDALSRLYMRARALIHPTEEAFGMTGLEAAAHGAPIIFPRGSGVTDLFTHGVQGFFPKEGDLDEFASGVQKLTLDERLAWRMGQAAWDVAKNFTWEKHARTLSEVLGLSGNFLE
jgi:glycosyltransferase involved in cell wall biosynthesis